MITTQAEVRAAFWDDYPEFDDQARRRGTRSKGQNAQTCDCRMTFCDFIDSLERSGEISEALAGRVTL